MGVEDRQAESIGRRCGDHHELASGGVAVCRQLIGSGGDAEDRVTVEESVRGLHCS